MVHAFRLIAATGFVEDTAQLWAAVYLHDIARRHDDVVVRENDVERRVEDLAGQRRLHMAAKGEVETTADSLVSRERRRRHVVLPVEEFVPPAGSRKPAWTYPVIPRPHTPM
jgi:hypothetical protein